jgi:hypothetical protein
MPNERMLLHSIPKWGPHPAAVAGVLRVQALYGVTEDLAPHFDFIDAFVENWEAHNA